MIRYRVQDITTIDRGMIAHGVNCQCAMGAGVALALLRKWPEVRSTYMNNGSGPDFLGDATLLLVEEDGPIYVANCYSQEFCGPGDKEYASREAIEESLSTVYSWAKIADIPLYLPKIGAGLGGLNWLKDVRPIIERLDSTFPTVDTYICVIDSTELEEDERI